MDDATRARRDADGGGTGHAAHARIMAGKNEQTVNNPVQIRVIARAPVRGVHFRYFVSRYTLI
ncbi:MAG: hypothetical protein ACU0AX_11585 [Roseovarius sp.]|uniref:hypothetical protein n=1 Tax=Sagittula sp. TaxID=2038081 RepID=UPI004059CA1E